MEKKENKKEEIEKFAREMKQESEKIIKEEKIKTEKENLKKQLKETKKLVEERLNQLKYLQADFDNYRKKFDKEKEQIIRLANENLIRELIVILDDFEASLKSIEDEKNKEGSLMLRKKFFEILEKHGLKEIESIGEKFDPNFHEVLCKEVSGYDEDKIIDEIQKGYCIGPKVIRTSKVKISKSLKGEDKLKDKGEK